MSSYSNIAKSKEYIDETPISQTDQEAKSNETGVKILRIKRNLVVNGASPIKNASYDDWEFSYFKHLINMRNIFIKYTSDIITDDMYTPEFFEYFCSMIYEGSSGYVSSYINNLTEKELQDYFTYLKTK